MAILLSRCAAPASAALVGAAVFFAPAGMIMTTLLVTIGLVCTGMLITAAAWNRSGHQQAVQMARVPPSTPYLPIGKGRG